MKRLLVGALLLSGACLGDLLVGPKPNIAPLLDVAMWVSHGEELRYVVDATFRRGSNAEGDPLALIDSILLVDGISVFGVARSATTLSYTWQGLASAAVADTITVRGPAVAGLQTSGTTMAVPVPTREDPLFRDHVAGDDLLLRVSPLGDTIAGLVPGFARWILEIRDVRTGLTILRLDGAGIHPSPLPVPWQLLMATPGDSLSASLQSVWRHHVPDAPYGVALTLLVTIGWQIRVVAPPTP